MSWRRKKSCVLDKQTKNELITVDGEPMKTMQETFYLFIYYLFIYLFASQKRWLKMWTAKERERDRFCSLAVCPAVNCRKNEHHQQKVTEKNRRQQKAQKKHPSTQPRSLRATELVNHLDKVHHRSAPVMLLFSRISFNFSFFAGFFFQSFILFFFCRRFFFSPIV